MFTLPRQNELERCGRMRSAELVAWDRPWLPLLGSFMAIGFAARSLPPWGVMTLLTAAIFFGFKLQMLHRGEVNGLRLNRRSRAAFLLLWPGMNPAPFGKLARRATPPRVAEWFEPTAKTLLGVGLQWNVAPRFLETAPLVAGWLGMIGWILLLHCGLFHLAALAWRGVCVDVEPIMNRPALSRTLAEFWGRRWNRAFRFVADELFYRPLARRVGPQAALAATFLFSGIVHDLAISVPARDGYGRPTLYFLIQAAALLAVHTTVGRRLGLQRGFRARLWAATVLIIPLGLLAHRPFIETVMLPLLRAIQPG